MNTFVEIAQRIKIDGKEFDEGFGLPSLTRLPEGMLHAYSGAELLPCAVIYTD